MTQELEAGGVGPVQVIEDEQHRRDLRLSRDQFRRALQEQEAFGVGIADPISVGTDLGYQARQRCALGRPQPRERRPVAVAHQARDDFDPRLIRDTEVLVGVAEQHDRPFGVRGPGGLGDEGGLSHPGLTRDEQNLAPLRRPRLLPDLVDVFQLRGTTVEPEQRVRRRADQPTRQRDRTLDHGGLPHHLDCIDRLRQALQLQRAKLDERSGSHDGRPSSAASRVTRIWPALRRRAQPRRFDDRVAEVVVVLLDRLTDRLMPIRTPSGSSADRL